MLTIFNSKIVFILVFSYMLISGQTLTNYTSHKIDGASVTITSSTDQKLKITSYGARIVRVQVVRTGEDFYSNDHYEMVAKHNLGQSITIEETSDQLTLQPEGKKDITIVVRKQPLRLQFKDSKGTTVLADSSTGINWSDTKITVNFTNDNNEHFCGLGHGIYGRVDILDLRGKKITRNYGEQAVLMVPFYMSSKGYGVFLNSTFPNTFSFGNSSSYSMGIDDLGYKGRMDYFFIGGKDMKQTLDLYTILTGRPRLPQKSMFGLQLSDKYKAKHNGEAWWKSMITEHRKAGYAIDVIINDNNWRAGGGEMNGSKFEFDKTKYPDPAEYKSWCDSNGLTVSLDLNRNTNKYSSGWNSSFNIPGGPDPSPDYTSKDVLDWTWKLFWDKAFNPALKYPGDAIWMDETDAIGNIPNNSKLANGLYWAEMENYYAFLVGKAVGQQGWDPHIGKAKRPFIWNRCGCSGMQRYATMWSGDIKPSFDEMQMQVRGMLASGLSGFPYFNHDAGGFFSGVNDDIYRQWAMAMGSFTPIWRPHGMGESRWPTQRSQPCKTDALTYSKIRYTFMPYIYSCAYLAHATGLPMARAMFLEYPEESDAWKADLQYLWGDHMLVAPVCSEGDKDIQVWLPPDTKWYDYWNDKLYSGGSSITRNAPKGVIPLFVRAGAIIPQSPYVLSTFFIPKDTLIIDVYAGADGTFNLYDDDGVTEKFQDGENAVTQLKYIDKNNHLAIGQLSGSFSGAPKNRSYKIRFHGLSAEIAMSCNGTALEKFQTATALEKASKGQFWDTDKKILTIHTGTFPVNTQVNIIKQGAVGLQGSRFFERFHSPQIRFYDNGKPSLHFSHLDKNEHYQLKITNLQGSVVFSQVIQNQGTIAIPSHVAAGVYLVRLITDNVCISQMARIAGRI